MEKSIYTREYAVILKLLREARKASKLTQVQIAKKIRQSQAFVSKVELGDRRLDIVQLRTFLKALDVKLVDFVTRFEKELTGKKPG